MKRKPIKKGLRHNIFVKDNFTCRYCGKTPPEVILEIDHIIPFAEGGKDEEANLVTSCRDCNRGKSDKVIATIKARPDIAELTKDLKEKKAQLQEYYKHLEEIESLKARDPRLKLIKDYCAKYCGAVPSGSAYDYYITSLKSLLTKIDYEEIIRALQISVSLGKQGRDFFMYSFGILHNWIRGKDENESKVKALETELEEKRVEIKEVYDSLEEFFNENKELKNQIEFLKQKIRQNETKVQG